jgi:nucleoside-diphosphate kinase
MGGVLMQNHYTLVLIKPSAVRRRLCGEIISRYERAGLGLVGLKLEQFPPETFAKLYQEHQGKDFYPKLVEQMSSDSICALVLTGPEGVAEKVRALNGATNPVNAAPGTIRGDYAAAMDPDNIVHASDSPQSAEREIKIFFPDFCFK